MGLMINILTTTTGLLLAAAPAWASEPNQIPEPGMLGLLVAGGIVGTIVAIRKRRK